jgi:hypothetical protein
MDIDRLIELMKFHPKLEFDESLVAFVIEGEDLSRQMAERFSKAYNFAVERFGGHGNSFWADNDQRNAELIAALRDCQIDTIISVLNNPAEHMLFWGVDRLTKGFALEKGSTALALHLSLLNDGLVRLAEAVGAEPVWYPEAHQSRKDRIDVEKVLSSIDLKVGTTIDFPNPFPNEFGIRTSRGVASYRALQSIYQAWRLLCLSKSTGKCVVEIGPGIGRTAYYARKFGLTCYSTVDLPLGNIAQACFLSRALGEDTIALPGEHFQVGQIRIETPSWYLEGDEKFDIALNVDSMTEMSLDKATAYVEKIAETSRLFVSINHEIN